MSDGDLVIGRNLAIPAAELKFSAVRSRGPGGQHVNKVATAVQLKFDVSGSHALPDEIKERLLSLSDRRISADGIITIKAQRSRSRERNQEDARKRLTQLLAKAAMPQKKRIPTRPGRKSREKRLEDKSRRAKIKQSRGKVRDQ